MWLVILGYRKKKLTWLTAHTLVVSTFSFNARKESKLTYFPKCGTTLRSLSPFTQPVGIAQSLYKSVGCNVEYKSTHPTFSSCRSSAFRADLEIPMPWGILSGYLTAILVPLSSKPWKRSQKNSFIGWVKISGLVYKHRRKQYSKKIKNNH